MLNIMKKTFFSTNIFQRLKTNLLLCKHKFFNCVTECHCQIKLNLILRHSVFLHVEILILIEGKFCCLLTHENTKKSGKNQGSFEVLVGCQNIYERKKIKDYLFNLVILMK